MTVVYNSKDFMVKNFGGFHYYIDQILPVRSKAILFGLYKTGKSFLGQQVTQELAAGTKFLGLYNIPKPVRVMYLSNELPEVVLQERMKPYYEALGKPEWFIGYCRALINTEDGLDELINLVTTWQPQVLIHDCLYSAVMGDIASGEVANAATRAYSTIMDRMADLSLIVIHHQRKTGDGLDKGMEELLGSIQLLNWPDNIIRLTGDPRSEAKTLDILPRHIQKPRPIALAFDEKTNTYSAKTRSKDEVRIIIRSELSKGDRQRNDLVKIVEQHGISSRTFARAITEMKEAGEIGVRGSNYSLKGTKWTSK